MKLCLSHGNYVLKEKEIRTMEERLLSFSSLAIFRGATAAKITSSCDYLQQVLSSIKVHNVFISNIVSACKKSQY